MRYCGITVGRQHHHLCAIEEARTDEPPVKLPATFFEPGSAERVVAQLQALGPVVVAVDGPLSDPIEGRRHRVCDQELARRGATPNVPSDGARALRDGLRPLGVFKGEGVQEAGAETEAPGLEGEIDTGVFQTTPVFETNTEGVFCALQGRRVPARRHPLGIQVRIEELADDQVIDEGGDLWNRRIEEIEAAAAALCAHRYAVGHACWVGDPAEGVIVLPGSHLPETFSTEGVLPPVLRAPLPGGAA
jgi:predicted nuclease with RNAse H fold